MRAVRVLPKLRGRHAVPVLEAHDARELLRSVGRRCLAFRSRARCLHIPLPSSCRCQDGFGNVMSNQLNDAGVAFSNAYLGGQGIKGTRIIFVNGDVVRSRAACERRAACARRASPPPHLLPFSSPLSPLRTPGTSSQCTTRRPSTRCSRPSSSRAARTAQIWARRATATRPRSLPRTRR